MLAVVRCLLLVDLFLPHYVILRTTRHGRTLIELINDEVGDPGKRSVSLWTDRHGESRCLKFGSVVRLVRPWGQWLAEK